LVGVFERLRDLTPDRQRVAQGERTRRDLLGQRRSFNQLEHEAADAAFVCDAVNAGNVGMIQRGEQLRLASETCYATGILRDGGVQNLDGHVAPELGVAGTVHFAHAAGAERGLDLVYSESRSRQKDHGERRQRQSTPTINLPCRRLRSNVNMPRLIQAPAIVAAAGTKPKKIEEFAGRVNSGHANVSVARMTSPPGWQEAGQRPEFEEITVVLRGMVRVEHES